MFNVRLAGDHLYGKQLSTWLSLVVSLMASFVLSFFPLDVLDEIWDLIESVFEGFLTFSFILVYTGYVSYYCNRCCLFYLCSILSHNLGRSSGHADEFTNNPFFHLVLFSAALVADLG